MLECLSNTHFRGTSMLVMEEEIHPSNLMESCSMWFPMRGLGELDIGSRISDFLIGMLSTLAIMKTLMSSIPFTRRWYLLQAPEPPSTSITLECFSQALFLCSTH